MMKLPMNAEVGHMESHCDHKIKIVFSSLILISSPKVDGLMVLNFSRLWQVMSDLLRPWALILPQLWCQQAYRCQWPLYMVQWVLSEHIYGPKRGLPSVPQILPSLFWIGKRPLPQLQQATLPTEWVIKCCFQPEVWSINFQVTQLG